MHGPMNIGYETYKMRVKRVLNERKFFLVTKYRNVSTKFLITYK